MRVMRVVVVLALIAVWGAFLPVAMAADHCAAMASPCQGPCAASVTVTPPAAPPGANLVRCAPVEPSPSVPRLRPSLLEPPPEPSPSV